MIVVEPFWLGTDPDLVLVNAYWLYSCWKFLTGLREPPCVTNYLQRIS